MTSFEKRALIFSALACALGLGLALCYRQGHWFARSGSIVTVIAVIFASLQLRERVASSSTFVEDQLKRTRSELVKHYTDEGLNQADSEAVFERVAAEMRENVADVVRDVSHRLYLIELWLFIVGTLIWGYGDIPLDYLLK